MTVLVPMDEDSYAALLKLATADNAADSVTAGRWTDEEALERSKSEIERIIPKGRETADHFFLEIRDGANGEAMGGLWFGILERARRRCAFVFYLYVRPEHQRQGHATRALRELEEKVRSLGISSIGLHVFGHKHGAFSLYSKLGYETCSVTMYRAIREPDRA